MQTGQGPSHSELRNDATGQEILFRVDVFSSASAIRERCIV